MAFPFLVENNPNPSFTPDELAQLRHSLIVKLFGVDVTEAKLTTDPSGDSLVADQLAQITRILGRTAGTETTVYDNGSVRSGASTAASSLTLQVERALTQVLGRSPGRGPDGFISALNSAFPTANGQVMMQPARSLVSLHSSTPEGFTGQLSVEQANLYRQASIIGSDALKVLDGLTPFDPKADNDAVEALRSLVRSQIRSVIDEFGRLDEPRTQLVDTYFKTLLGKDADGKTDGYLYRLGEEAFLGEGVGEVPGQTLKVVPVTLEDETQVAGFELLLGYVDTLNKIWTKFKAAKQEDSIAGRYSERLSRASIMLPVVSDSNANFMSAMDSIGFSQSERRSDSALFSKLQPPNEPNLPQPPAPDLIENLAFGQKSLPVQEPPSGRIGLGRDSGDDIIAKIIMPDMTMNDFDEWVDRFATLEAPSVLSTAGQFGLDFVTDQADTLFWTIGVVLYAVSQQSPLNNGQGNQNRRRSNPNQGTLLGNVLAFERVQQSLSELIYQLDTLASLGKGSISSAEWTLKR